MPTSGVREKTYVRLASQKGGVATHLAPKGVLPQAAPRERAGRRRQRQIFLFSLFKQSAARGAQAGAWTPQVPARTVATNFHQNPFEKRRISLET